MNDLIIRKTVSTKLTSLNNESVVAAKNKGYTIFGDIAIAIENNDTMIKNCTDALSAYIANNANYKLLKRYEEESSLYEKYISNNSNRLANLRNNQEFNNYLILKGIRFMTKLGTYFVKKGLDHYDNLKMKETVWKLSVVYANAITGENYIKYPSVDVYLSHLSNQLFGKKKNINDIDKNTWDKDLVLPNENNYKNIAFILYMIYSQKHLLKGNAESIPEDLEILSLFWKRIGIIDTRQLFNEFHEIDMTIGYNFVNTNIIYSGIVNNLSIALSAPNDRLVRRLNSECRKYIPNGDTQHITRTLGKAALCAGCTFSAIESGNPILIQMATTSALSLFSNTDNTEVIGNSLNELGIDDETIKNCLVEASEERKKNKYSLIDVKE